MLTNNWKCHRPAPIHFLLVAFKATCPEGACKPGFWNVGHVRKKRRIRSAVSASRRFSAVPPRRPLRNRRDTPWRWPNTDGDEVQTRRNDQTMLKLADNPPMLSPWAERVDDLTGRWWVGHTKARFEKAFAWDLARNGVGYFLPMCMRTYFSSGKKRRVLMPLFSSYVFINGTQESLFFALETGRLCQSIPVIDQQKLNRELSMIHRAIVAQPELGTSPLPVAGRRYRVIHGPLIGLEGIVIECRKLARTVLEVSILGQGAVVEIDSNLLEPV